MATKIDIDYDENCKKCGKNNKWSATIELTEKSTEYTLSTFPKDFEENKTQIKILASSGGYTAETTCYNCKHINS